MTSSLKLFFNSLCGKNIGDTLGCASCATFLFLPHFDVIFDLLLNRPTATWNLFVKLIVIIVFVTVAMLMEEVVVIVVLLVVIGFARLSFWISKDRELRLYYCELSLFLVPCLINYTIQSLPFGFENPVCFLAWFGRRLYANSNPVQNRRRAIVKDRWEVRYDFWNVMFWFKFKLSQQPLK